MRLDLDQTRLDLTGLQLQLENGAEINEFSTDGTLAGNSDTAVPTEKAVKTYVDGAAVSDHGGLGGLGDDDHTQYALLTGRAAGQSLYGGTGSGKNLNLYATSSGTGLIKLWGPSSSTIYIDSSGNVGIKSGTIGSPKIYLDPNGGTVPLELIASPTSSDLMFAATGHGNTFALAQEDTGGTARTFLHFNPDGDLTVSASAGVASGNIIFETAGSTRMTLDETGVQLATGATVTEFSTDGTLAGDSDDAVPTEKAVKAYVDATAGLWTDQGTYTELTGADPIRIKDDTAVELGASGASDSTIQWVSASGTLEVAAATGGALNLDADGGDGYIRFATDGDITMHAPTDITIDVAEAGTVGQWVSGGLNITGSFDASSTVRGSTLYADSDSGGITSTTALTNSTSTDLAGAEALITVGTTTGPTQKDGDGWIKLYVGTQAVWIPYWT